MTRDDRQKQSIERWRKGSALGAGHGTLQACTGYGKTRVATTIARKMFLKDSSTKIVVVVPTIPLRNQWEGIMRELGLINNTTIYVINTLILSPEVISCNLLILDEIHKYAADTFFEVFNIAAWDYIMGLTATLERMDSKHTLLQEHCPIIDDVTLHEARKHGWVSDYIEYNLYVEMNKEDAEVYNNINTWLGKAFAIFHHDFYVAMACCSPKDRYFNGKMNYGAETFVRTHVNKYGEALSLQDVQGRQLFGQALVNEVVKQANNATRLIREREAFLTNNDTKVQVAKEIIETLNMKTVTFGKSTECADKLTEALGSKAASYHSYLESEERAVLKVKEYKTEKSAIKFSDSLGTSFSRYENELGVWKVYYYKLQKFGKDRLKKEVIARLENDEIEIINSAKALDLGLDVTGMQLAIIISGDSNPTTQTQRIGRVIRKEGEKTSIIVNILLKDTQDEKWCKRRQKGGRLVRHINEVDDIMI